MLPSFMIEKTLSENWKLCFFPYLFYDGGRYYVETSPLIVSKTGFYMITASVMKELM